MNERIQELVKQAGEYVNKVYTPPVRSKTPGKIWEDGHIGWHTQFNQKFAELIVRECGYYADVFESLGCPVDMDPTETKPSDYIKKHFGVEE